MVGAGVLSLPYAMSELGWYVLCRSSAIADL
jgi:amino acid permease